MNKFTVQRAHLGVPGSARVRSAEGIRVAFSLVIVIVSLLAMANTHAGVGTTISLPPRNKAPRNLLSLELHTRWPGTSGIQPVRVVLHPVGTRAFLADRNLTITLATRSYYSAFGNDNRVTKRIKLDEGSERATATILVPFGLYDHSLELEVREDGRLLRELSDKQIVLQNRVYWENNGVSILVIDRDVTPLYERDVASTSRTLASGLQAANANVLDPHAVPNLSQLVPLVGRSLSGNVSPTASLASWDQVSEFTRNFEYLPPSDLPERLPGLSSIDLMMIDLDELNSLTASQHESLEILRTWLIAGGSLCISHGGSDFENLELVERALRLPPPTDRQPVAQVARRGGAGARRTELSLDHRSTEEADEDELPDMGPSTYADTWFLPHARDFRAFDHQQFQNRFATPDERIDMSQATQPPKPPFVVRRVHLGTLIVIREGFEQMDQASWHWLLNSNPGNAVTAPQRFGVSLEEPNEGYWDLLIPGVGLPPVNAFQVLLTLFVMLVGPASYFLLQRYHRLNWLLATVPAGAAVTIMALLLFAMFTDGISARARFRSLTHIDQRTGDVACLSRQSYYAGVAPSSGLSFPNDAIVLPLEFNSGDVRGLFQRAGRVIEYEGAQVIHKAGAFPSRTCMQYFVAAADTTDAGVDFAAEGNVLRATNRIGTTIAQLWARDANGQTFGADDLAAEDVVVMKPLDRNELVQQIGQAFNEWPLEAPAGFDRGMIRRGLFNRNYLGSGTGVTNREGILETNLLQLARSRGVLVQPNSYVAIVDRSPWMPRGLAQVAEIGSLHVITGRFGIPANVNPDERDGHFDTDESIP